MTWRNTRHHYGWISILLHWLVAVAVIGLFGLGIWMVDLGYYDPWYQRAPDIHKSIGILLFAVMLARLAWRRGNPRPQPLGKPWEQKSAELVHGLLYLLLLALMLSGYLISTADGRAIEVFGLFSVPATLSGLERQEDIAGAVHEYLAYTLMGLTALHALAALKHHFIDRDPTLKRMLGARH
jgi:cytochrome b561